MKHLSIKQSIATPLSICLLLSAPFFAHPQTSVSNGPPKILVVDREFLKPGKVGGLHEKTESAFVRAASAAIRLITLSRIVRMLLSSDSSNVSISALVSTP